VDNKPSFLSKTLYVELVNNKGEVVQKRMLPVANSISSGDILLNKETPSGNYRLNAYTLWMLNFPDFIFSKELLVLNTDQSTNMFSKDVIDFSVQFFPEGGDLVAGLNNKVAFKAVQKNGLPAKITGRVIDAANKEIASLSSVHDGMGYVEFQPVAGTKYLAEVTSASGLKKTVTLPASKEEGVVMHVINDNPSRLFVQLERSAKNAAAYNLLWIVAQINNEVVYSAQINFDADQNTIAIPKKDLPSGIMQITVFKNDLPIAERLAFISNHELPKQDLLNSNLNTAKRERNSIQLDVSAYKTLAASVSVTNSSGDALQLDNNIFSNTYLNSDLKGYIHQPGYYFKNKEQGTLKALDLVMLTHGWRRFKWQDLIAAKFPSLQYPVESGITITGKLTKTDGTTSMKNSRVDFITKGDDSTTIASTVKLNENSEFFISDLNFKKSATIYYQGTNEAKTNALTELKLYPGLYDTLKRTNRLPEIDLVTQFQNQLINKLLEEKKKIDEAEGKTLSTVVVRTKKLSKIDSLTQVYATDIFQTSDQTIPMDGGNYFTIWQFLQRNIAGLEIAKNDAGLTTVHFSRYKNLPGFTSDEDPGTEDPTTTIKFFLNEIPVTKDVIEMIDPTDVGLVKVWKGNSGNILGATQGVIGVYTQKNKSSKDWRQKGFSSFTKQGYSVTREFFNMNYSRPGDSSSVSDIRPTLFWSPKLKIDKAGKATIEFYNDDIAKSFKLVINGIDADGKMLHIEKELK
jgi:hypothetical protein